MTAVWRSIGRGTVRVGRWFSLAVANENMVRSGGSVSVIAAGLPSGGSPKSGSRGRVHNRENLRGRCLNGKATENSAKRCHKRKIAVVVVLITSAANETATTSDNETSIHVSGFLCHTRRRTRLAVCWWAVTEVNLLISNQFFGNFLISLFSSLLWDGISMQFPPLLLWKGVPAEIDAISRRQVG